jgi:hypothetical protein
MINIQCSPFTVEIAAVEAARGAAGVHSRSLSSHCQGSDRGFSSTPLLDGLAHRLDPTAGDRQSRNQPMGVSS